MGQDAATVRTCPDDVGFRSDEKLPGVRDGVALLQHLLDWGFWGWGETK